VPATVLGFICVPPVPTLVTSMGSEPITLHLKKAAVAIPWGFRLQGGIDFASPLCISMVNGGTLAEAAGVRPGDQVVSIAGANALKLRHNEAKEAIVKAGTNFEFIVQRGGAVWKPAAPAPVEEPSVAKQASTAFSAPGNPNIRAVAAQHTQKHNSPLGLYSEDNIAEVLAGQAEVVDGTLGINFQKFHKEEVINTNTPTYRMIHGIPDDGPAPKPREPKGEPEAPDAAPIWAHGGAPLKSRPMDNERHVNGVTIPTSGGQVNN